MSESQLPFTPPPATPYLSDIDIGVIDFQDSINELLSCVASSTFTGALEIVGGLGAAAQVSMPWDEISSSPYENNCNWAGSSTDSCYGLANLTDPVSPSGVFNSPAVELSTPPVITSDMQSPLGTTGDRPSTNSQVFTIENDNNNLLAISEIQKEKRLNLSQPDHDGYRWRKYGQKPIKDFQYSRSYYRCTHRSCPATKRVHKSLSGHVTHIIYKGEHIDDPPQNKNGRNQMTSAQLHELMMDSEDSADVYMTFEEDEEEPAACADGRRWKETVADPKIVVQTRSEVDVLDDGYRWRKYGQKVVKGNSNPRSYYKCTSKGCDVRKQVERSSIEPEDVITTYDGKHNHDVPGR